MPHLLLADTALFLGRFHPLLVHLPIGILLLAVLLEGLARNRRLRRLGEAVPAVLLLGVLSTLPALVSGFLLAGTGLYHPDGLAWHRNAGLALAVISLLAWLLSIGVLRLPRPVFGGSLAAVVLLLVLAGHGGANLTHGPDYLASVAPPGLKSWLQPSSAELALPISSSDSIVVYDALVQPVLSHKCGACHNDKLQYAGLDLSSWEGLRDGGASGEVLRGGSPGGSELFHRVSLPSSDRRFMPPQGEPLTYPEQRILAWWIEQGADPELTLADSDLPADLRELLAEYYGWSDRQPPFPERNPTEPIDSALLGRLLAAGYAVEPLAQSNNYLSVATTPRFEPAPEALTLLAEAADQVTWLDLSGTGVGGEQLAFLSRMHNLSRLRLARTRFDDAALAQLQALPNLESLNLVGTAVSDAGVDHLARMPALQRLFVWDTRLTAEGLETLQQARPDLELVLEFRFAEKEN